MVQIWVATETKRVNDLYVPYFNPKRVAVAELRGEVSVTSPVFDLVEWHDYYEYNMAYVPLWKRYYFITDVSVDGNHTYIKCQEDYLATWYNVLINSTFYCVRSYSSPTAGITDTLFPAENTATYASTPIDSPWTNISDGEYVLAISSGGNDNPHIGTNSYYILKQSEMTEFMRDLMGKADFSFSGIADSISKAIVNPMQYIRSCMWFPFEVTANTKSVTSIDFGWWSSSADARVINLTTASDLYTQITIDVPYFEGFNAASDIDSTYQKYPPYSRYYLYSYPFGLIEIPSALITRYFEKEEDITIRLYIDTITGMGTMLLYAAGGVTPYYMTTSQVGVSIPVGQVIQDFAGAVMDVASGAGQLFSGHVVGAANGVYSALDSLTPSVTVSGASGGFAQLMIGTEWRLAEYHWPSHIYNDFMGSPCCKNKLIGGLRGYALFSDVDIEGEMLNTEKQGIKQLLESGIFIARESEWNSTVQLEKVVTPNG